MATSLDLQEQEQVDALKAFWKQYGNLITWVLTLALAAFAAWNGWQWYERDQAAKAGAIYDELDRAVQAGDAQRAARAFGDLRDRHAGSTFAAHGALLVAKLQADEAKKAAEEAKQLAASEAKPAAKVQPAAEAAPDATPETAQVVPAQPAEGKPGILGGMRKRFGSIFGS